MYPGEQRDRELRAAAHERFRDQAQRVSAMRQLIPTDVRDKAPNKLLVSTNDPEFVGRELQSEKTNEGNTVRGYKARTSLTLSRPESTGPASL